ncbi:MAG: TolB family protein, partial [Jiangellaceae bacterium]
MDDTKSLLWLLPPGPGESRVVAKRPGGVGGVVVARDSGTVLVASDTFPSSADPQADEEKRKERTDRKVSAILHERYPVRYWDHDLGSDAPRLLIGEVTADEGDVELRDLTPDAGRALDNASYDISGNRTTVVTTWNTLHRGGNRPGLAVIDVATGERRMPVDDDGAEYSAPRISPDGSRVVALRERLSTPTEPIDVGLVVLTIADGSVQEVAPGWDRWPGEPRWLPDGSTLIAVADEPRPGAGVPRRRRQRECRQAFRRRRRLHQPGRVVRRSPRVRAAHV